MKTWVVKLSYPSGRTTETTIEAETKEEAGQRFFPRMADPKMIGDGKVEIEIFEKIDIPKAEDYTREVLIGLCEDAFTPMAHWYNRDSYSAHSQLGVALALLKCDVPFRIEKCDKEVVWVEFYDIEGFNYHEYGGEESANYDTKTAYIPTRHRLEQADGKDWY